jgi:hypothetical protein
MEVLTTETPTSWPQRLQEMDIGQELKADILKKNTVRDAANKVFLKTGRRFSTNKKFVDGTEILFIKRVE